LYALIEFDEYNSPSVAAGHDQLAPIVPLKLAFDFKTHVIGSREKIHLALDWTLTIHKAQELTFIMDYSESSDSEMQLGSFLGVISG
jgi:hypothetical protein